MNRTRARRKQSDLPRSRAQATNATRRICPLHKVELVRRPREKMTYEQAWCGEWYDCPRAPFCYTRLEQSQELKDFLAEQAQQTA